MSDPGYRRDLGDGLVLRWATDDDIGAAAELYQHVFRDSPESPIHERMALTTADHMGGRHPLVRAADFAVVEDTRRGGIVAATSLMDHIWQFDGVPFGVGRPEIVASHPDYRNRGLIRAIFELIHARSAVRGHLMQGITGIDYYYRQFGYEYALELGGRREISLDAIPTLKEGQPEPFALRPATAKDLPLVLRIYEGAHRAAGHLVFAQLDAAYLRWSFDGITPGTYECWDTHMVTAGGEPVGYVWTHRSRRSRHLGVWGLELLPYVSLYAALPSILRALKAHAPTVPTPWPNTPPLTRLLLLLGSQHRAYEAIGAGLMPHAGRTEAWYVRVPDLPAFVRHVAPVLERRLAGSVLAGHSGEAKLTFYREGLRLAFEGGKLAAAEPWRQPLWGKDWGGGAHAGFPPLTFTQLLLGYRSLDEMLAIYPDVWANDEGRALLDALFPKRMSFVLPQD
jgi:GNAT superfamily N-acetyltransferase